jgi:VWFA-related protein
MRKYPALALLWSLAISVPTCPAQTPPSHAKPGALSEEEVERVDVTLVNVLASVADRRGRYVPNLRREDFRVYEDGVEQRIAHFAAAEAPFTVALLLDTSGSARFRLKEMQGAAFDFVDQLRTGDRVMVVSFNENVEVLAEATGDRGVLREAIRRAGGGDGTHLYDAVDSVVNRLDRVSGRKALVLFTDGIDNVSRVATRAGNVDAARRSDGLIYTVQYDTFVEQVGAVITSGGVPALGTPSVISTKSARVYPTDLGEKDYARARDYMGELAAAAGGRYYHADDLPKIREAFARIAEELRWQYSLGYYPNHPARDGQRHGIKVRINSPKLVARARDSYVSRSPVGKK